MNIYLVERKNGADWDEFDSEVVCAESEKEALSLGRLLAYNDELLIELIGDSKEGIEKGVILGSFKAG